MAAKHTLDPELLDLAMKFSGEHKKTAAVTKALEEFIAHQSKTKPLDLMGALEWDDSYDHIFERSRS